MLLTARSVSAAGCYRLPPLSEVCVLAAPTPPAAAVRVPDAAVVVGGWVVADEKNCPVLGGKATFSFGEAIKYLKRGMKVAREGWNGKKQYIQLATGISYRAADGKLVNCEHEVIGNMAIAFVGTSGVQMGWLASQADMLAEDWIFAEE